MHVILPYLLATGGAVTDTGMNAVTDPEFSQRNNHFIFTEDYRLLAAVAMGANITRANFSMPSWNAWGLNNIWPVMLSSANILSPPRVAWFPGAMPMVPQNEEMAVNVTDSASENAQVFIVLTNPSFSKNLPPGQPTLCIRATSTITQVAGGWSAAGALTFQQNLRGGVYSLIGAEVQGSGTAAFRFIFPRSRFYQGRRIRPGWLAQQAIGDLPEPRLQIDPYYFGEWGRFHTFEPPQMEIYSIAGSSSTAHEIRLYLTYIGQSESQYLDSWVAQGWAA